MDPQRFDELTRALTRSFAASASRRGMLRIAAAGALGGILGSRARSIGAADKVYVCHKGNTLHIDATSLHDHLGHGDTEGPCCLQTTTCRPDQVIATEAGNCTCACPAGSTECAGLCRDLAADPDHCGACDAACAIANAEAACQDGTCVLAVCLDGFGDCNGDLSDGCETDLRGDPANCGGCGTTCAAPAGGRATCDGGVCGMACDGGLTLCGTGCVDLQTDLNHCGSCVNACGAPACSTATCGEGGCVLEPIAGCCVEDAECDDGNPCTVDTCDPTEQRCVHAFADEGTPCDDDTVCNGRETCDGNGSCQPGEPLTCDDGNPCTVDTCDPVDGCQAEPTSDGAVCGEHQICVAGACECIEGLSRCTEGGWCVSDAGCCIDDDCFENGVCLFGTCACPENTKLCADRCIPEESCCVDDDCGAGRFCAQDGQCDRQLEDESVCSRNEECVSGTCFVVALDGSDGSVVIPGICGRLELPSEAPGIGDVQFFAMSDLNENDVVGTCEEYHLYEQLTGVYDSQRQTRPGRWGATITSFTEDADILEVQTINYPDRTCRKFEVLITASVTSSEPRWLNWIQTWPNTRACREEQERWMEHLIAHEFQHSTDAYTAMSDFSVFKEFTACSGSESDDQDAFKLWLALILVKTHFQIRQRLRDDIKTFDDRTSAEQSGPHCILCGPCANHAACDFLSESCCKGECVANCPGGTDPNPTTCQCDGTCLDDSDCTAACQTCDLATNTCVPCPDGTACCNGACHETCPAGHVRNPNTCECERGTCAGGVTSCNFNIPRTCGATMQCVCRSQIGGAGNGCFSPGFLSPQHVTPCTASSCGPGYRCVSVPLSCAATGTACAGLCAN